MKVVISQPRYLPWLGYVDRIAKSDILVLLDCVQFNHQCWQKRNQIKTQHGSKWLTIPIAKCPRDTLIHDIKIDESTDWQSIHWRTIVGAYKRSPNWEKYSPTLHKTYKDSTGVKKLTDVNQLFLQWLLASFGIKTKIIRASDLAVTGKGGELLKNICEAMGATEYISGINGQRYIEESMFAAAGIKLNYLEYQHPVHRQQFDGFTEGLAAIDYLFNVGGDLT